MQYEQLLNRIVDTGGTADAQHAASATRATLDLIGRRMAGGEPANLADQLPDELKDTLTGHTGAAETFDVNEFLRRLAEDEGYGCTVEQALAHARTVFGALGEFVSTGEMRDVKQQLPEDYAPLFD